jgi:hypothetical protein
VTKLQPSKLKEADKESLICLGALDMLQDY